MAKCQWCSAELYESVNITLAVPPAEAARLAEANVEDVDLTALAGSTAKVLRVERSRKAVCPECGQS